MEISESQYISSINIIIEYTKQINKTTSNILKKVGKTKTPYEIRHDKIDYFPNISIRLLNLLRMNFDNKKICDITKKDFFSMRGAGVKTWIEFCKLTDTSI